MVAEASLSFLGLGAQPPEPSLGAMLSSAQDYLANAPTFVAVLERLGPLALQGKMNTEEYRREADSFRGRMVTIAEAKSTMASAGITVRM